MAYPPRALEESRELFLERECRPEDIDALLQIEAEAGRAAWTRAVMEQFRERKDTTFRVITTVAAPRTPIAFHVVQEHGEAAYLANLAVAVEWRRRRVATYALERVADRSRQRGLRWIELHVQEENLGAQLLYRKNGFLAVEVLHGYYPGQDGYAMRKDL